MEAVWKALTEADEITRWFAPEARVEPGAGGHIWMSWGSPWKGENKIEVWEPTTHLRTSWPFSPTEAKGEPTPVPLTVDYYLARERVAGGGGDGVVVHGPPSDFAGTAENLGGALLRVANEHSGDGGREVWFWLAAYGRPAAEMDALQSRWAAYLKKLFPEAKS